MVCMLLKLASCSDPWVGINGSPDPVIFDSTYYLSWKVDTSEVCVCLALLARRY